MAWEDDVGKATDWDEVRTQIGPIDLDLYEVGGSLRDELLGKEPEDLDIAVVGSPLEDVLSKLGDLGSVAPLEVAGKTIGARLKADWTPDEGIEFALARRESSTGDGHTDFEIVADPEVTIEEDLDRRDFTANAIARKINPDGSKGELVDPHGGQGDIADLVLRQVGPTTIAEDPLRVLRGFARHAKDGLVPEAGTLASMADQATNLVPGGPLSAERIFKETKKIVAGPHAADALRLACDCGVFAAVYPELEPMIGFDQQSNYHDLDVAEHTFMVLQRAEEFGASYEVRWAALLHDSGKPGSAFRGKDGRLHYYGNPDDPESLAHETAGEAIVRALLGRLKAPNDLVRDVARLVREHMFTEPNAMSSRSDRKNAIKARRLIQRVGRDHIEDLMMLRRCDRAGKVGGELDPDFGKQFEEFESLVRSEMHSPLTIRELAIDGNDLIDIGMEDRKIGETLNVLLERVVVEPDKNQRERLLDWAKRLA